jgi:Mannosylglycerate hydrolase MGH1-like glycoside hydrolase domain
MTVNSEYLKLLKNRINLREIPFSERGSRLLIFQSDQQLTIRLAERWFKREGQLSAYRKRPPLIDQWVFIDGEGSPLKLSLTTYPDRIYFETRIGTFTLAFLDAETLLITLPTAPCGIKFNANLDKIQTDRRGGVLRLTGDIRRNVAYTTNARIVSHVTTAFGIENQAVHMHLDASEGRKALLLNITPRLGFNRYIPDPAKVLDSAFQRWHDWFANAPQVEAEYQAQYYYAWWIMRAGLISTRFYTTREAMTPSMIHYVGVWQWDAYFHALAYRHLDKHLAHDQIRILLDHQREDGMIPDAIHDEGTVTRLDFPVVADVTSACMVCIQTL